GLIAALPAFFDALGAQPDLHVGVISSSVSVAPYTLNGCENPDDGALRPLVATDGCNLPATALYASSDNFTGSWAEVTGCMAEFGVSCDGGTIARSAADYTTCQPRGDSYLYHPQHYVDFLQTLAPANRIITEVIAAPPTPFGVSVDVMGDPILNHSCMTSNVIF